MELKNFKEKDPYILLSILNMKLRDNNPNLSDLCKEYDIDEKELIDYMNKYNFTYCEDINQFR